VCSFVCCVSFDRGVILCDVLFVCCVLLYNHCHRVKTHLQLNNSNNNNNNNNKNKNKKINF
jgi:hypothetical protein